ncbi:MAG TPA: PAS domain S-box protein [Fimbriimonadaceae bacterium]|nr:PAS domain S-box protein [Fimbriimonadaceae bacterium]
MLGITVPSLENAIERTDEWLEEHPQDVELRLLYERALRARLENTLRGMQARFAALLDGMLSAVLIVNGRTGIIRQVNRQAETLFGYPQGQLVGVSVELLVPEHHRTIHPAYRIGFLASIRKREMGYHPPIFALRADGEKIEVAISLTSSSTDDDVMVVCTDYGAWRAATNYLQEESSV